MTHFVVVAGAWLGAWAWDEVASDLRAAGHDVHPCPCPGSRRSRGFPPNRTHTSGTSSARSSASAVPPRTPAPRSPTRPPSPARSARGPTAYVKCLLDGDEPMDAVAGLLKSALRELVEMNTGLWPMFSQPRERARILHEPAAGR